MSRIYLLFAFLITCSLQATNCKDILSEKGRAIVIGVVSAVPNELGNLLELMEKPVLTSSKGLRNFYRGQLFGLETVLVSSRIGKVSSAATAAHLIVEHQVDFVIFTGVAGAIDPILNVGDVVIGKQVMQHDMNGIPFCPRYELPLLKISQLNADQLLEQLAYRACKQLIEVEYCSKIPSSVLQEFSIDKPKVLTGLIITGDEVISQDERRTALKRDLPDALCVEMEGGSVGQVCHEYEIPWVVIRTISDHANHINTQVDVRKFVQEAAGYYAVGILENLYQLLNEEILQKTSNN